ncbi:tryptophan synthase subunit alpha [Psychrobacillus lasiicapitis]|uniref:Tryptophan synthase alpha chain n=1 Tax=Psychrobacillus lasiicapitis TaxID=1636719 RepID=A0A544TH18_9BACI|nr:tryptophan synthase subunit alpha [Psychrobacillus lasiicapitis]TQR16754.1 tryptophan synthase subunit alpha [Psychrobacillus lasiicapitis]GGA27480.1 tryptophan synthase alpha chain [Psychrobacillus lasiicapitis]
MTKTTLTKAIQKRVNEGEKAFIPYIMGGDGSLTEQILFLQEAGATAIEVGIPFSDPVADGPTIQRAGERALEKGATLRTILEELKGIRNEVKIPLVIMTYINPILSYGIDAFAQACAKSGVYGLIVPDVPLEENEMLKDAFQETDVSLVPLVSLTSPPDRIEKIVAAGEGFIYAVTVNGITGVRDGFDDYLEKHLNQLKRISSVSVLAGFGISTPEQVKSLGALVDGVIVGSAIVEAFHQKELEKIRELVAASKKKVLN